ncbi:beta-propeller domain-containing protein [Sutcliffiella cohnii]|uniref:beta-propeller domain-containing protein n=1 Tax=Sutcliffiella cohnii TaxID=33932 RepID=UPI002E223145|nr:beta-propeller domain-containing protein [Sutcliffiella cohnii]
MNKKAIIFSLLVALVVTIFGYIYYYSKPYVVNGYGDGPLIVLSNKKFVFNVSEEIDEQSLTDETIFVTNKNGERVPITVDSTSNTISILPPSNGYDIDMGPYKLKLSNKIKSINGEKIRSGLEVVFDAKENLPSVTSKKELNQLFSQRLKEMQKETKSFFGWARGETFTSSDEAMDSSDSGMAMSGAEAEYSETNIQVTGVDEADIVKTDGSYIYQVIDNRLTITNAQPVENVEKVAEVRYQNFSPFQLYVDGNRLVVIGNDWKSYAGNNARGGMAILPIYESAKVIIYDITNKEEPVELRAVSLEGHYLTSRKIDDYVYLITNLYPNIWELSENSEIDLRPRYMDTISGADTKISQPEYEDIYYIPESNENNFMNIIAINIKDSTEEISTVSYLGSGQELYMNREHLYTTVPTYNVEDSFYGTMHTDIYKFSINGPNIEFVNTGTVDGRLLNQFSMDEHNGYFRVATTKGDAWDERSPSSNNLFILDDQLNIISTVEDLARGERIYSARFMGDKGYIVTFKEVDPLFVFDLSDPYGPKVLGELKIPGFSNYLHPYDENHLIGFGHHTRLEKGEIGVQPRVVQDGVKISLFDVSDPTNPTEKFSEIVGNEFSYSPLNHDHKALLFNKEKDIFAFPITTYNERGLLQFQGALVYGIDPKKGFTLHDEITHAEKTNSYESWEDGILRVLYINDYLYAVSPNKISTHKISW